MPIHSRFAPLRIRQAHHAYLQASTMTFLGIVVCQIGTAFAARPERASLRTVAASPPLQSLFDTAVPDPEALVLLIPFPFIVWSADDTTATSRAGHEVGRGEFQT